MFVIPAEGFAFSPATTPASGVAISRANKTAATILESFMPHNYDECTP
jgi:hypothetical protein